MPRGERLCQPERGHLDRDQALPKSRGLGAAEHLSDADLEAQRSAQQGGHGDGARGERESVMLDSATRVIPEEQWVTMTFTRLQALERRCTLTTEADNSEVSMNNTSGGTLLTHEEAIPVPEALFPPTAQPDSKLI